MADVAISALAYVSACNSSADEEESSSGTAPAAPDVSNPLSAVVAGRFTGVPSRFPGCSVPAGFMFLLANSNTDARRQISGLTFSDNKLWLDSSR